MECEDEGVSHERVAKQFAEDGKTIACAHTMASTMHMPKPEASDSIRGGFLPHMSTTWLTTTVGNGMLASKNGAVLRPQTGGPARNDMAFFSQMTIA